VTPRSQTLEPVSDRLVGADASLRQLLTRLAIVELRVRAAVRARRAAERPADERFRGLVVSDRDADIALARPGPADRPGIEDPDAAGRAATAFRDAEAIADEVEQQGAQTRLRALTRTFALAELDVELLLVALAPDVDPRFERLYGYLNDDVSRRRASVGLALALCGVPPAAAAGRARLGVAGPLVIGGLVVVEDPERPFQGRGLRVPDRVASYLLGDDGPDAHVVDLIARGPGSAAAAGPLQERAEAAAGDLTRAIKAGANLAYLHETVGSDARRMAVAAASSAGHAAVVVDLTRLAPEPDPGLAPALALEARLRGGVLVAGPVEPIAERNATFIRRLADLACPVVLHGTRAWDPAWSSKAPLLLEARPASAEERGEAWRAALEVVAAASGSARPAGRLADEVAAYPFRLGPSAIARATAIGSLSAVAAGRDLTAADLAAGVRAQNATGLEKLARRVEPRKSWSDLVLTDETMDALRDLSNRARYRDRVLDGWGLADPSRGRGLTALFTGDSGTGKTVSAEVLAGTLGLDLYVIDLSSVVDKYIGETEKNLDRVFSQADGVNGVLLFDEADAIFGKRSEVRDARDRYANVEIAYLLQRMERFDGMAILTTNLRANLDEAFLRRLDVLIDFPMPEEELRRRLWTRHLPAEMPLAPDIDLDFLARSFRISGGSIRNIVATAAYNAAAADRPVTMADLIKGTEREYRKLGHLSTEAEFGPYYQPAGHPTRATEAKP
jgi:hypothetical protein